MIGNWHDLGLFLLPGHACCFGLGTQLAYTANSPPSPPPKLIQSRLNCLPSSAPTPAKDLGEYSKHARLQIENLLSARPDLAKTTGESGPNDCTLKKIRSIANDLVNPLHNQRENLIKQFRILKNRKKK